MTVRGRAMLVRRLEMLPVECVARGYLTGSGLMDYRATGAVCGIALPAGLVEASRLPEPIFTPATKAELGEHDENVTFDAVVGTVGAERAEQLRALTLALYSRAADHAATRGLLLADTKVEFGLRGNAMVLGDEVLTPDSSRFWPADGYAPGQPQPSFDKQYVRDWLTSAAFRLGPGVRCAAAAAAGRRRGGHPGPLHRRLRTDLRSVVRRLDRVVRCAEISGRRRPTAGRQRRR